MAHAIELPPVVGYTFSPFSDAATRDSDHYSIATSKDRVSVLARGQTHTHLLAPLSVVSEWVRHHMHVLSGEGGASSSEIRASRVSFISHLVDLLNLTKSGSVGGWEGSLSSIPTYSPLAEVIFPLINVLSIS